MHKISISRKKQQFEQRFISHIRYNSVSNTLKILYISANYVHFIYAIFYKCINIYSLAITNLMSIHLIYIYIVPLAIQFIAIK